MLSTLLRRVLPLLVLGGLTLGSCVVHDHDHGHDGPPRRGHRGDYRGGPGRY